MTNRKQWQKSHQHVVIEAKFIRDFCESINLDSIAQNENRVAAASCAMSLRFFFLHSLVPQFDQLTNLMEMQFVFLCRTSVTLFKHDKIA